MSLPLSIASRKQHIVNSKANAQNENTTSHEPRVSAIPRLNVLSKPVAGSVKSSLRVARDVKSGHDLESTRISTPSNAAPKRKITAKYGPPDVKQQAVTRASHVQAITSRSSPRSRLIPTTLNVSRYASSYQLRSSTPRLSSGDKNSAVESDGHPHRVQTPQHQSRATPRRLSSRSNVVSSASSTPSISGCHPVTTAEKLFTARAQAHLFHLQLLHVALPISHASWLASAYDQLEKQYNALRQTQTDLHELERTAHELRNIVALHRWSGSSAAYLMRKLNILIQVLERLEDMTAVEDIEDNGPPEQQQDHDGEDSDVQRAIKLRGTEKSETYSSFIVTFADWLLDVQRIWTERDDDPENFDRFQTVTDPQEGFKNTLRGLTAQMAQMMVRLDDLRDTSAERARLGVPREVVTSVTESREEANIVLLTDLVFRLVEGMQEELQIIREIEFEVMEGERAWLTMRDRERIED